MKMVLLCNLLLITISFPCISGESQVLILAENLVQVITSSTLEWVPASNIQNISYENAVVGAVQISKDESAYKSLDSVSSESVYVCRARQNVFWVAGQLRPKTKRCIISLHGIVHHFDNYEILINIEGSARISWVERNKYTLNPQGSVTGGEEPFRNFIARRANDQQIEEGSLNYLMGKLDPSVNLGKFTLVDENDVEREFEDGEVLVETEPEYYEFKNIKFDFRKRRKPRNHLILGKVTLKNELNEEVGTQRVESVISYKFTYSLYWGHGHGLLTGLPFRINFPNRTAYDGKWSISDTVEKVNVHEVEYFLAPGTAVEATLYGNYGELDTPFTATVVAYYKDGETKERLLKDNQRETSMYDLRVEFGRVFFIHNNSFVPTTTTTTTTTMSTTTTTRTTTKLMTTTQEAVPLTPPIIEETTAGKKKTSEDGPSAIEDKLENEVMSNDEGGAQQLQKKRLSNNQETSSTSAKKFNLFLMLLSICIFRIS